MSDRPKHLTAASKLMSNLVGVDRPHYPQTRHSAKLSRESLIREMNGFYNNGVGLIQSCAQIAEALRRPEIQSSEKYPTIKQHASVFNVDLKNFAERLKIIKIDQNDAMQVADETELHMQSLRLGEAYQSWTGDFMQVVMPTFETLAALINECLTPPNPVKIEVQ